jgi:hypothetical protein
VTESFALLGGFPRAVRRSREDPKFRSLVAVTAVTFLCTLFHWLVEGWSVLDSFYSCVITLSTVGYRDPRR